MNYIQFASSCIYINCMLFVSNKLLEIFLHPLLYRQCWWELNYNISGQQNGKYLIGAHCAAKFLGLACFRDMRLSVSESDSWNCNLC